ncbi:hypothetical protein HanPI659440_Chr00c07g0718141 [Helianthus annuus]|nr:hypothetical protein HanPI659440_Chr00c07g0718141 [Helianthus annuus]
MSHSDPQNSPTAVKPDLSSVITQTIGRQLHNVASFLAPPPQQSYSSPTPPRSDVSPSSYEGLKNDLAEIGVSLKTSLSLLSPQKAVTGISKFASSFLQFDKGGADRVVGVTDHVVDFVREVSLRPHCWVDFPLSLLNKGFIFIILF